MEITHDETTSDKLIGRYHALRPYRFDVLERLTLWCPPWSQGETAVSNATLTLRATHGGHSAQGLKLKLTFLGINQLHLDADPYTQLLRIEIVSIRDRHWEKLHYAVKETEQDRLSLLCDSFKARLISS